MRAAAFTALLVATAFAACTSEESTIPGPTHNPTTSSDGGTQSGGDARAGNAVDSGTPPPQKPGSSSLTVSNDAPASGDGSMTVDSVVAENAGGNQSELTRVTVLGNTSDKKHKFLIYFFIDNGQMSSVTHWWGDNVTDAFQTDGIAYCDALPGGEPPQCQGLYHDPSQRFITFTGTVLHGKFQGGSTSDPTASTIDGALLYPAY